MLLCRSAHIAMFTVVSISAGAMVFAIRSPSTSTTAAPMSLAAIGWSIWHMNSSVSNTGLVVDTMPQVTLLLGFCQAGTSGEISKNFEILIGSPGPYTWRGTIFANNIR